MSSSFQLLGTCKEVVPCAQGPRFYQGFILLLLLGICCPTRDGTPDTPLGQGMISDCSNVRDTAAAFAHLGDRDASGGVTSVTG